MRDSSDDVPGQRGHTLSLLPLPRIRTEGDVPSCRLAMVNLAVSSARAPLLYKNSMRAWSRAPIAVARSGWFSRASISAFSRYPIKVFAAFLNGIDRISEHQATWIGERTAMNRASEWIVASR